MDEMDLLRRLGVALAIGLLVGLERGWRSREEPDNQRAAGLRTFALTGLVGGVAGALSLTLGGVVLGLAFLGHTLGFAAFHYMEAKAEGNYGATSVVAGMLTFLLGAFAVMGQLTAAIAAGVVMTLLLALRERLHSLVAAMTFLEVRAVLTLVAMSFLLLPLLPNRPVDPWQVVNPYIIWLMAITIAVISFGGYVAIKVLGEARGVLVTALAGGLASSTAVTLSFARLARAHPRSSRLLAGGILASGVVMFARVGLVAGVLNPGLVAPLLMPLAVAGGVTLAGAGLLFYGMRDAEHPKLDVRNPLELGTALKLAGLIAVIMLGARGLKASFGDTGILALAALSGIADVDAITLSMAQTGGQDVTLRTAGLAILIAVLVNTTAKAVLAWWEGGRGVGLRVAVVSGVTVAAALGAAMFA